MPLEIGIPEELADGGTCQDMAEALAFAVGGNVKAEQTEAKSHLPLHNPQAFEHRDFSKIRDERKGRRCYEHFSYQEYW